MDDEIPMSPARRGRPRLAPPAESAERVDKSSWVPAYVQLAKILRRRISEEIYLPGGRLPSESVLAKTFGVSPMTARQAVGMLTEEGLVRRAQGSGTYVRKLQILKTHFALDVLHAALADQEQLEVKVQKATVERAGGRVQEMLGAGPSERVVVIERLIRHRGDPLAFQVAYTRFDPGSPILEKMLNTAVLTEFFFEESHPGFKKGILELLPVKLSEIDARLLGAEAGTAAFKLEQVFYDFNDRPAAFGWFLVCPHKMRLVSRVGVWDV